MTVNPNARLTGETKRTYHPATLNDVTMHRVEYVLSSGHIIEGGWVESLDCLQEDARVHSEAMVFDGAVITGSSRVFGSSKVFGSSVLTGTVVVLGGSEIDNSKISGNSFIEDAQITDSTLVHVSVESSSRIESSEVVGGKFERVRVNGEYIYQCDISRQDHILKLSNFGSESMDVHLTRRKDGTPWVKVGCWEGPLSRLMDKVYDRQENDWDDHSKERSDNWLDQYKALDTLLRLRVESWDL